MSKKEGPGLPDVNAHLHTPYSFSAFRNVDEALHLAQVEGVKVVGINDFYTTQGYGEWAEGCQKRGLYPLFGIEFISLNEADQLEGTYLSGKGLTFPFRLEEPYASQLASLQQEANRQVEKMCEKLNELLIDRQIGFVLDLEEIRKKLTHGSLRERHLARALRMKIYEHSGNEESQINAQFSILFGDKRLQSALQDDAGVENEIRAYLLKAGGAAFVPEDPAAFLPVEFQPIPFWQMIPREVIPILKVIWKRLRKSLPNAVFTRWSLSPHGMICSFWRNMLLICMSRVLW